MLTYRPASTLVIILAASVILLTNINIHFLWFLLPLAMVYLFMLVMGSVNICSGFYLNAFCGGNTNRKIVALTFDDGPDENNTPEVLEILARQDVPAAFFLIGKNAENHPGLVKQIISEGHSIGLHSYSHPVLYDFSGRKKMENDLLKSEKVISDISGKNPGYFRPPFGVTNPVMAKVVKKLGYRVIGWSVRSFDTNINDAERLVNRVIEKLHPGAVVLLHDTQEVTVVALEKIILKIKEEGYLFVSLEEMVGTGGL